jgi:hypothetical protein
LFFAFTSNIEFDFSSEKYKIPAASLVQGHIANFDLHFNELKVFDGETELLSEEI